MNYNKIREKIKEIKEKISIIDYLNFENYDTTIYNKNFIYSPFREENNPSFRIDFNKWYDFGKGVGGDLIKLVMLLKNITFNESCNYLIKIYNNIENITPTYKTTKNKLIKKEKTINYEIKKVGELNNIYLVNYLQERKINTELCKKYVNEIYLNQNGKNYFYIGFKNDSDGFELRNKYFKGSILKKSITTIINDYNDDINVFEGFIDFLSYITLKNDNNSNYIILNSITNVDKFIQYIKNNNLNNKINLYLDNDTGGIETTKKIMNSLNNKITDKRELYQNFNDLNDYLVNN